MTTALIATLVAPALLAACPPAESGRVSGSNTVDIVNFSGEFEPGTYTLGVRAEGDGNNSFRIAVQRRGSLGWSDVEQRSIDLGDVNGCGTAQLQFTLDADTEIRYRFSRSAGTQAVDYDWDHDFTVVWGGLTHRCLTC